MSSLVLRECRGGKNCSKCDRGISIGEKYWSGPYTSLCVVCHDEKREAAGLQTAGNPGIKDDSYVVSGACEYCPSDAIGILWNHKVCAAHINQAITESI